MNKTIKNIFKKILVTSVLASVCISCFTACTSSPKQPDESNSKLKITATLFPQYDFARQIAGDKADVTMLLPRGVESHSFEPSPADIINIGQSDLFIYTGEDMEPWAKTIIEGSDNKNINVVDISANITLDPVSHDETEHDEHDNEHNEEAEHEGHHHSVDPHIWTSPANAITIVQTITDALCEADEENADYYKANAKEYTEQLEKLDKGFEDAVKNGKRDEIIFGGRFPFHYFAERYGIKHMSAYPSCSSETEPSVKVIADIIKEIKDNNIPVIYYEELVNPTIAKSISDQTGAKMLLFHSCHNVSKEDFEAGVTYLSLMEQNLKNLKEGLN